MGKGMLTPNESSEDEDLFESQTSGLPQGPHITAGTTTTSSMVDKRKIAEAVQSLINNKPSSTAPSGGTATNIKFKFRMKFKSTQAASDMKKAVNKALNQVNNHDSDASGEDFENRLVPNGSNSSTSNSIISRQ